MSNNSPKAVKIFIEMLKKSNDASSADKAKWTKDIRADMAMGFEVRQLCDDYTTTSEVIEDVLRRSLDITQRFDFLDLAARMGFQRLWSYANWLSIAFTCACFSGAYLVLLPFWIGEDRSSSLTEWAPILAACLASIFVTSVAFILR